MVFVDIKLACVDCGADFVFTAAEQFYFVTKSFANLPKHCKKCKAKRKRSLRQPVRAVLHEAHINCAACGLQTTVPFTPRQGRPVLCSECFHKQKAAS
jgi:CxxC-x17-CxxC domain-containing protein